MSDTYSQLRALLKDVILPNLKGIHASQVEQRFQTDCLNQNLEEFRSEMQIRFAELRAELAACRQELEGAMAIIRDNEEANAGKTDAAAKKTLIH